MIAGFISAGRGSVQIEDEEVIAEEVWVHLWSDDDEEIRRRRERSSGESVGEFHGLRYPRVPNITNQNPQLAWG